MRPTTFASAICLIGLLLCPGLEFGQAETPAPLQDISVNTDDISLSCSCMPLGHVLPGPDRLSLELDYSTAEAVVSPSEKGTAVFTGNVTVDAIRGERIVVGLTSWVSAGWQSSCIPSSLVINDNDPHPFVVNVTVPENERAAVIGNLTIEGQSRGGGIVTTANVTATITVKPYYRVMIDKEGSALREVPPGGKAEFTLKVWNVGNAIDSYSLELTNNKELRDKGWDISINVTLTPKLDVGRFQLFMLTAKAPSDLAPYKNEPTGIDIKASSTETGGTVSQSIQVRVVQKGVNATNTTAIVMIIAVVMTALVLLVIWRRRRRARLHVFRKDDGGIKE